MNIINWIRQQFTKSDKTKQVALVLSGGGARGLAHIGAIEELLSRNYEITSIAATSMGALVGGFFAAGKLDLLKEKILSSGKRNFVSLMNISLGLDHVANGNNLTKVMKEILGEINIEDLPVDYCCCASDLVSGSEHVFKSGPLAEAIRASISIPGFFKPVEKSNMTFVDGSVHNPFPLNRVNRHNGDILVGVNACAPNMHPCKDFIRRENANVNKIISVIRSHLPLQKTSFSENYMNLFIRVARISVQNNTRTAMQLTPPDICAEIPMDKFGLFDYNCCEKIIAYGRRQMSKQLDIYEKS